MSDELISVKTSIGWLEMADLSANPTDTSSARRGFAMINDLPYYWTGSAWTAFSAGAATAYDDIGDPDASGSITMGAYTGTYTSSTANWGGLIVSNTHANPTAGANLLTLGYTADGDAHGIFLICKDNSSADTKFQIAADGAVTIAGNAAGTDAIAITAGDVTLTSGHLVLTSGNATLTSGDLTLSSGDLAVTGTGAISGNFAINTNKFQVTAASGNTSVAGTFGADGVATFLSQVNVSNDNVKLALGDDDETDSYIYFDGSNLCFYDSTIATVKTLTQLASGFPSSPTISGDVTITDGKLTWTDAADEAAGVWTFAGTTVTDIAIASSITSGKSISIVADSLTSGSMLYLESSVAGMGATGNFIECYNGSASVFEVGKYGAVIIAGNASGADVVTLTAGDVTLTSGHLVLTLGNATLTNGNLDMNEGKIEVDSTADETTYVKRNHATSANAVVEIEQTHTGATGSALLIDQNATGNAKGLEITHDGGYAAIDISAGAARTGNVINITMANQLAQTAIDITGAATGTSGEGIIHLDLTGVLAGNPLRIDSTGANAATGQLIYAISSGNLAGATNGAIAYFEETGAAQATSYAVYISSTSNEALHIDAGVVQIDEAVTIGVSGGAAGADLIAYGTTNGKYLHWDESADTLILAGASILEIGGAAGAADGLTVDFDGADIDIDAVTANDNIKFGSDVDTNVIFNTTSGAAFSIDHGADTCVFSATAKVTVTGNGTGTGLAIPFHATNTPSDTVQGSIFFEVDANKLWVYNGTGWVGTTLA